MLWAVELRREESRCQLQDLIRPAQLPILRTKLPHFRGFHTRRPRPSARVHLRLSHPVVDGLRRPDPQVSTPPTQWPPTPKHAPTEPPPPSEQHGPAAPSGSSQIFST